MLKRLVKRSLRRCGIRLPFTDVICAEHIKSICIGAEGRAKVTVQEKLVFLDAAGDWRPSRHLHGRSRKRHSTTSSATLPTRSKAAGGAIGSTTFVIDWMPKAAVTRYALYQHEYSWFPAGIATAARAASPNTAAIREPGIFSASCITPQAFEAAVVFERPRWPLLNTERRIMRYALKQIEAGAGRPSICDNGQRIEWRIAEPKIGTRYMCVAFHQNGLLLWNDNLQKNSLAGRVRRLVGRLAPG